MRKQARPTGAAPHSARRLTREQMDALSDDPNEMQRQLQDMAGPGAVLRIDSFEGGQLPPKAMIKAIHITRDQFAAENHGAEGTFIDIITQPGVGPDPDEPELQLQQQRHERAQRFHADQGRHADAELQHQYQRRAHQEQGVVFSRHQRPIRVRIAGAQHRAAERRRAPKR